MIIVGLVVKLFLNHNLTYWAIAKSISILLFAIGLIILTPLNIDPINKNKVNAKINFILKYSKKIIWYIIFILLIIGLEELGQSLNYSLRDCYLSNNTGETIGYFNGIKRINIVKVGYEDFYLVDFNVNGKIYSNGLLVDYGEKDVSSTDEYRKSEITKNNIAIGKLKGSRVKIIYSNKFPSFFRIE